MEQRMFSVVVPVYNVEQYLGECLDSLLAQTFTDFEVLIIDDRSTDGSLAVAQKYAQEHPDKIRLLEHAVNKGLGGARNTGIEHAEGTYLLFLDSDDYLVSDAMQIIADAIVRENADVVEFGIIHVDDAGNCLLRDYCAPSVYAPSGEELCLLTKTPSACTKVARRSLFMDHDIRYPEKRYYEDYWTTPKFWMLGIRAVTLPDLLYCYRQRAGSIMHDTNIAKAEDIMSGTDELLRFCEKSGFPKGRRNELEYLAIRNLMNAIVRVNGIDPKSDMQNKLWSYWITHFPNYAQNPYWYLMDDLHQRLFKLVTAQKYRTLYLTFHCRARAVALVKKCLSRLGLHKM